MRNATPSLQSLSAEIGTALGISAPNSLSIQFVNGPPTSGTDQAIVIDLTLDESYSQSVSLDSLALSGLGPLTLSGSGSVTVTVGGTVNLDFGYDLTNAQPFLVNTTGINSPRRSLAPISLTGDIGSVAVGIGSSFNPASITLTDANGDA